MPAPRKACERCRANKTRCIWTPDLDSCVRCRRSNHPCSAPFPKRIPIISDASSGVQNAERPSDPANGHGASLLSYSPTGTFEGSLDADPLFSSRNRATALALSTSSRSPVYELPAVDGNCTVTKCFLPPSDEGYGLLSDVLHDFNSRVPWISPDSLFELFRGCYSGANEEKPLAWVLVYATLGIAHRIRAMSLFAKPSDTPQGDWYLKKILARLPELLLGPPSLRLVQASLGMAYLLETSGNFLRASVFVSTALHMARDLNYNDITPEQMSSSVAYKEMAYSFWIAFGLDAHFSIAAQRPATQMLSDISTPIPQREVLDWWNPRSSELDTSSDWNLNIFAQHASLALIEAEATQELFSVTGRKRLPTENAIIYERILVKLREWWENNVLSKLKPREVLLSMYRSDIMHSVLLVSAYFRTLYQLHATNELVGFTARIDAFAPESLEAMVELKSAPCYLDASHFLKLAVLLPHGNIGVTWGSMQAMLAAVCTLLTAHIVGQYDLHNTKADDLELCDEVLKALERTAQADNASTISLSVEMCRRVYSQACQT